MYNEGTHAKEEGVVLHRSMFSYQDHKRNIRVPPTFLEHSRYKHACTYVVMSMSDNQFHKLVESGMVAEELNAFATTIQN